MLEFKQTDVSKIMLLTLTELATPSTDSYYFLFTHVTTKETVSFSKLLGEDESFYRDRYNKFTINPSVLFAGKQVGEWHYMVRENTATGEILETGKMILNRETDFDYIKYNSENSFKTYNGG